MSIVIIEPTTFFNDRTGEVRYGFRIHDEVDSFYCDTWDKIPTDDITILRLVHNNKSYDITSIVDCLIAEKKSIQIGTRLYVWDQIRICFTQDVFHRG